MIGNEPISWCEGTKVTCKRNSIGPDVISTGGFYYNTTEEQPDSPLEARTPEPLTPAETERYFQLLSFAISELDQNVLSASEVGDELDRLSKSLTLEDLRDPCTVISPPSQIPTQLRNWALRLRAANGIGSKTLSRDEDGHYPLDELSETTEEAKLASDLTYGIDEATGGPRVTATIWWDSSQLGHHFEKLPSPEEIERSKPIIQVALETKLRAEPDVYWTLGLFPPSGSENQSEHTKGCLEDLKEAIRHSLNYSFRLEQISSHTYKLPFGKYSFPVTFRRSLETVTDDSPTRRAENCLSDMQTHLSGDSVLGEETHDLFIKSKIKIATDATMDEVQRQLLQMGLDSKDSKAYSEVMEASVFALTHVLEPQLKDFMDQCRAGEASAFVLTPESIAPTISLVEKEQHVRREEDEHWGILEPARSTRLLKFTSGDGQRSCTIPVP